MKKLYPYDSRLPMRVAIFMSGTGSNAKKIIEWHLEEKKAGNPSFEPVLIFTDNPKSNAVAISNSYSSKGLSLPVLCDSIYDFYKACGKDDLKDLNIREAFDNSHIGVLSSYNIDCIALAGYDRIATPVICNTFFTINVHPGYLPAKYDSGPKIGKPKYTGLAWIPSAKAILAGENEVHTSVHVVTDNLDCGPVLAVSAPQPVPDEVKGMSLEERATLIGTVRSIQEIADFIKKNPDFSEAALHCQFPIVKYASDCQNRLKVHGDWVVFPRVLRYIGTGRYACENGSLFFDGEPIPNGKLIREGEL